MSRKTIAVNGAAGMVFTNDKNLFQRSLELEVLSKNLGFGSPITILKLAKFYLIKMTRILIPPELDLLPLQNRSIQMEVVLALH